MGDRIACFKAYDIRGRVPDDLNEERAYAIGRAYATEVEPEGPVAIGRDNRLTSKDLSDALTRGLNEGGVDTRELGVCGTEVVYFASSRENMGGGVMVTASHNPVDYNGMKFVRSGAVPISGDTGLRELERRVADDDPGPAASTPGKNEEWDLTKAYIDRLLSFIHMAQLKPLKIVVNPGNGCAGPYLDAISEHLPFEFVRINFEPNGNFPNGIPNPLLEENQPATSEPVKEHEADLGLAWDGDFDRCFFFDENGDFIPGYYIVGLFAEHMLKKHPNEKIIHDPRMTWNTTEMVKEAGGTPIQSKTGHAFIKERMRAENAVYGGEMSAHHYFRDFTYCDSGMVPWLLLTELLCNTGKKASELIAERRARYPSSGEINRRVSNATNVMQDIEKRYKPEATNVEHVDGLSMAFGRQWRFNLRSSQTEPILRLNVEACEDEDLMRNKTNEILQLIEG